MPNDSIPIPPDTGFIVDDTVYETTTTKKFQRRKRYTPVNPNELLCIIPGIIRKIFIRKGQKVHEGEKLFVLEAMKMENEILSPHAGTIRAIHIIESQLVTKGQLIIEFEVQGAV
jgi:biotin carboxyl carrier protein